MVDAEMYPSGCKGKKIYFFGILLAIIQICAIYYAFETFFPHFEKKWPHFHTVGDRLLFTLRLQISSISMVFGGLFYYTVARLWKQTAKSVKKDPNVRRVKKIFKNALQMFVISCVNQLALCTYLRDREMKWIVLINTSYTLGRVFFWIGFIVTPYFRPFGYVLYFTPLFLMTLTNLTFVFTRGITYDCETLPLKK